MMKITSQVLILPLLLSLISCGGGGGGSVAADVTPDAFSFADQTDVALSTPIESAAITVAGINSASTISVTGGEYSIDGGSFTSAAGTVNNGQSITVRHTSSADFVTETDTTLTIGGVSDVFTTTTVNMSAPDGLAVVAGEYSGQASLSWNGVLGATEYTLYYATESFADMADVANYASLANGVMLGNQTSPAIIGSLSNNTTYYFVVTYVDGSSESSASSEVSALVYAPLNDTGITTCSDATSNGLTCPQADFEGQDAEYGRDVIAYDDTDGHAGFSFTKLDSTGAPLADQSVAYDTTPWSCVQDNVTGLIWEVKTLSGLQSSTHDYTWYNSTGVNDGGAAGTANGGSCFDSTNCDTEKFVAAVNATGLCGADDWRLPSREELTSLIDSSVAALTIDTDWFPNTQALAHWSASPYAGFSGSAWNVRFSNGHVYYNLKDGVRYVRLVRGGQ
jgi:hypothetical protein